MSGMSSPRVKRPAGVVRASVRRWASTVLVLVSFEKPRDYKRNREGIPHIHPIS